MYYINACSTISHQASFQNKEWVNQLKRLTADSVLVSPNYKEFVNGGELRRMGKIIRMGIACSKDCVEQSNVSNPDAIIVGTGLGCLTDTEKFLKNTLTIEGLIPPTAFIQSTHNTIAGQISLALKNHNYNMTHTQNSLSFEHSLMDAMLLLNEDNSNVLIGSADENIPLMDELANQFGLDNIAGNMTTGASFFMLSDTKTTGSKAKVIDSYTTGLNSISAEDVVESFLKANDLTANDIDLVLFNSNGTINVKNVENKINSHFYSYEQYCGYYFSNSAFGMHIACEILDGKETSFIEKEAPINRILLYNTLNDKNIGLTLLQSLEA